nr:hypothetical protein [uncultured Prevotella sp.]
MKKIVFLFLVSLMTVTAMAQGRHGSGEFNERLFNAKVAEVIYRLKLSDKQAADFRPVYEQYNRDMMAAWGKPEAGEREKENAAEQVKRRMERQQRGQAVRLSYTDKFAKVLNDDQLKQFYQVENDIQKRLRMRKHEGKKYQRK